MFPEVDEAATLSHELGDRRGAHDLAAMRDGHHPCRPIHVRAEIVAVAFGRGPDMQAHPAPRGRARPATPLRPARPAPQPPTQAPFCVLAKLANTPSPVLFTTRPPCDSTVSRTSPSCSMSAARISSGCSSHLRVEPSISVKRNVTVPDDPALMAQSSHRAGTGERPPCNSVTTRVRGL